MGLKRTLKGHHEQSHAQRFDDLEEMNQFKGRSHLPTLTPGERTHIEGFVGNTLTQGLQSGSSISVPAKIS
jgi:hypothetical protein